MSRSCERDAAAELAVMTIAQIRAQVAEWESDDLGWALLEKDRRVGVRRLVVERRRCDAREQAESQRRERLLHFERHLWAQGVSRVAGVDEAGRGCLAGPVVAAAVVLSPDYVIAKIADSNKPPRTQRETLYEEIADTALSVGIGQVEASEIDRLNILQASLKAMRLALENLPTPPDRVLIDGHLPARSPYPEQAIIDGDARSLSIAAASIVAKVHRDRLMCECDVRYPEYGFAAHKGYGSAAHLAALDAHGPCPLHRRSFGPVAARIAEPRSELFLSFEEGICDCANFAELERLGQLVKEAAADLTADELATLREAYREQRDKLGDIGRRGEAAAEAYLEERGYRIQERRYRAAGGEIDLVAEAAGELVFVEVKASQRASHPEQRINRAKRQRLTRAARHYIQYRTAADAVCRFDVIAVWLRAADAEIEHWPDAFKPLD
ncbi:MAG: ribonuclease HII [Gemmatimonadetes bacterium]|nr:ribonuclease HII [Gemmatimonadota bacterium]